MRVAVAVHGRFHGFDLADQLQRRDSLAELFTTYPGFAVRRFLPPETPVRSCFWLELVRRGHQRLNLPGRTDSFVSRQFGRWLAANLPEGLDILTGWSSAMLEAIPIAQARGTKVVIERGSTHILTQQRILREAFAEWKLPFRMAQDDIIERECREYELADRIAVPTRIAADSFIREGIAADKLIINPYGVSLDAFRPPAAQRLARERPVIVCVGRVGIRKGLPALLQAFSAYADRAELHLVGPEDPEAGALLQRLPMKSVRLSGALSREGVIRALQEADVFCLPSLEEGLPLSLLQAMATGLPVIASRETGVETVDPEGMAGVAVPANRSEPLSEAMGLLLESHEARLEKGDAAIAAVGKGFDWSDYGDRTDDAYQKLVTS